MLDLREDLDLIHRKLFQFWQLFEFVHADDLDSIQSVGMGIECFVDLAILALADNFLQHVVINDFIHRASTII